MGPCGAPGPAHGERGGVRRLGTFGAAENRGGATVTAYRLRAHVTRAMPRSRRRAFGHISSASGAGGTRLRRRAPGAASRLEQ
jgi:hypothetical protein